MYINLRYDDTEALMNFIEIDGSMVLLCDKDSAKVEVIKKEQNNMAVLVKDGEEFDVQVEWIEDAGEVEAIWDTFEEQGANYFGTPDNLFGMKLTIK